MNLLAQQFQSTALTSAFDHAASVIGLRKPGIIV